MRRLLHRIVVWWRLLGRHEMTNVCVGVRNDASIDVDMASEAEDEESSWNFNNLSIEEGEFLLEELTHALSRARIRRTYIDSKKPVPAADEPGPGA